MKYFAFYYSEFQSESRAEERGGRQNDFQLPDIEANKSIVENRASGDGMALG